ncbi:MAG: hypothetical protein KC420_21595, partial [Myxococcales bacterium]|nr:hypothetical protein [Myxococcales bacterium]
AEVMSPLARGLALELFEAGEAVTEVAHRRLLGSAGGHAAAPGRCIAGAAGGGPVSKWYTKDYM